MANPKKDNPQGGQPAGQSNRPPANAPAIPGAVPTGGPNAPTAPGAAQQGAREEAKETQAGKLGGTNEPTPSGQQREGHGPPHQPVDPQATTQGRRPEVGGGDPAKSHPGHPVLDPANTMGVDDAERDDHDRPTLPMDPVEKAKARAGGGPVFILKTTLPGVLVENGQPATTADFPPNTDFDWLLRSGSIAPAEGINADGSVERSPEHLAEIDEMQGRIEELSDQLDAANKELRLLRHELRKHVGAAAVEKFRQQRGEASRLADRNVGDSDAERETRGRTAHTRQRRADGFGKAPPTPVPAGGDPDPDRR
jgi:hypothetical protein